MKREILEEVGIKNLKRITEEVHRFDWKDKKNQTILEFVYGVEVCNNTPITLSKEHTDFKWAAYNEAKSVLEKTNNKKALRKLNSYLRKHN